jgi:hypothetical protein
MQCGHCGTQINKGFSTCPACGAVYQKQVGWIAGLLQYFGIIFLLFGALGYFGKFNQESLPIGTVAVVSGIGISCLVLRRIIVSLTPYRWYR